MKSKHCVALLWMLLAAVPALAGPLEAARSQAGLAIEQYKQGHHAEALRHFTEAAALDPGNEDYVVNAAILSERLGQPERARTGFQQAIRLAAARGDLASVADFSKKVSELAAVMPAWVEQQMAKASALPAGAEARLQEWSAAYEKIGALMAAQKPDQAAKQGELALKLALQAFGPNHPGTLNSRRELATALFYGGAGQRATAELIEAERAAVATFGETHPETQAVRTLMGDLQRELGHYAEAIPWFGRAASAYANALGAGHPLTVETLRAEARAEELRGGYRQAAHLLTRACEGSVAGVGRLHPATASCYQRLGLMQFRQGEHTAAGESYRQALEILAQVAERGDPVWQQTRIYQADLDRVRAAYADAEKALLQLLGEPLSPALLLEVRGILAQLYEDQGRYPEAERQTREILAHESKALGDGHPNTLTTLNNLAGLQRRQSRLVEAEKGFEKVLAGFRERVGEAHPSTLAVMNNLALTLETEGLYDRAEPLYRKAFSTASALLGEAHPTTIAGMNNLAMLYESQGTFDRAEPLYQDAIGRLGKALGEDHPDTLAIRNNLGYLYLLQRRNTEAAAIFERVVSQWEAQLGARHPKVMQGINNLGRVRHQLGKLEAAEPLIQRALALRGEVLGKNHMDTLRSQHDLGRLYMDMGRLDASLELLQRTLRQAEAHLGEQHPYTFETLNSLALLQARMRNDKGAMESERLLFDRRTAFLERMLWATSENAREGYIRLYRPELDRYLSAIARLEPALAGRELMRVSLQRKGLLLRVSAQIQQVVRMADDPALKGISEALLAARKALATLTLAGPTDETATEFLRRTHALKEQISTLEGELGRASARFRAASSEISLPRLEENLADGAALVDFVQFRDGAGTERLQVAILRREGKAWAYDHHLYDDLKAVNDQVGRLREVIQDEYAGQDELRGSGMDAHAVIWAPISERLAGSRRVWLVPDGLLNIMPFNAMVNGDEAYLLAALELHTLTSSRDLIPSRLPQAKGGYLVLAGPDYDTEEVVGRSVLEALQGKRAAAINNQAMRGMSHGLRGLKFSPLPGAEEEGRLIGEQTRTGKVTARLIQKRSAEERALREVAPPEVLHIATHGFFLKPDEGLRQRLSKMTRGAELQLPPPGDNPLLRAGLAFAGINANAKMLGEIDTDNDGVLTALEVLGLDLTGTRVAILSACETGLGEIHEGEGVYGLRRSFQEAGAGAVINSLWEVSDAGTQALMTGLYQRMLKGEGVHAALRNTQVEMLKSKEWAHPYIWSAFFLVEGATGAAPGR